MHKLTGRCKVVIIKYKMKENFEKEKKNKKKRVRNKEWCILSS